MSITAIASHALMGRPKRLNQAKTEVLKVEVPPHLRFEICMLRLLIALLAIYGFLRLFAEVVLC
jgi:hypothetical protein